MPRRFRPIVNSPSTAARRCTATTQRPSRSSGKSTTGDGVTTRKSQGGDPSPEVFVVERGAACRDYHERFLIGPTFRDRRGALAEFAATFYQERLHVPLGTRARATMSL